MARLEGLEGQCINLLPSRPSQHMSLYSWNIPLLSFCANIISTLACAKLPTAFRATQPQAPKPCGTKCWNSCCAVYYSDPTRLKSIFLSSKGALILTDEGTAEVVQDPDKTAGEICPNKASYSAPQPCRAPLALLFTLPCSIKHPNFKGHVHGRRFPSSIVSQQGSYIPFVEVEAEVVHCSFGSINLCYATEGDSQGQVSGLRLHMRRGGTYDTKGKGQRTVTFFSSQK